MNASSHSVSRYKALLRNTMLVAGSLVFCFVVLELVVLRWLVPVTDIPRVRFTDALATYLPGQVGVFRIEHEHAAMFRINQDGWNSVEDFYPRERNHKRRIAIIGDSYVAALQVDYRESVAEKLADKLDKAHNEVFRFGMGGAPMSQYLHMSRHVLSRYRPDVVVIVLAHNDFLASYRAHGKNRSRRYGESFLTFNLDATGTVEEIPPVAFSKAADFLSQLASIRYLHYQHHLKAKLRALLDLSPARFEANIKVDDLEPPLHNLKVWPLLTAPSYS